MVAADSAPVPAREGDGVPVRTGTGDRLNTGTGDDVSTGNRSERSNLTGNVSSTDASANLLADVFSVHGASYTRNKGDSAQDQPWIASDSKGISLADRTQQLGGQLDGYLKSGGTFSDAAGRQLAQQFIRQLRTERVDHLEDRQGALEYAGANGIPADKLSKALSDNATIGDAANKLLNPNAQLSDADRATLLKQIGESAAAIQAGLRNDDGKGGKDQRDAVEEAKVISTNVAALQGADLSADQRAILIKDIASKSNLINNELRDVPNEVKEIQNDSAAVKHGEYLEAVVNFALRNPGHATKALAQLSAGLTKMSGIMEAVKGDRHADLEKEPKYIADNNADNEQNNLPILRFTHPYSK